MSAQQMQMLWRDLNSHKMKQKPSLSFYISCQPHTYIFTVIFLLTQQLSNVLIGSGFHHMTQLASLQ